MSERILHQTGQLGEKGERYRVVLVDGTREIVRIKRRNCKRWKRVDEHDPLLPAVFSEMRFAQDLKLGAQKCRLRDLRKTLAAVKRSRAELKRQFRNRERELLEAIDAMEEEAANKAEAHQATIDDYKDHIAELKRQIR